MSSAPINNECSLTLSKGTETKSDSSSFEQSQPSRAVECLSLSVALSCDQLPLPKDAFYKSAETDSVDNATDTNNCVVDSESVTAAGINVNSSYEHVTKKAPAYYLKRPYCLITSKDSSHTGHTHKDALDRAQHTPAKPYLPLPFYGEHKRAVSSLEFAPTNKGFNTCGRFGHFSINSNAVESSILATCASASADGSVKIWEISRTLMDVVSKGSHNQKKDEIEQSTEAKLPQTDLTSLTADLSTSSTASCVPTSPSHPLTEKIALLGHHRGINDVSWSPTSAYLATASDDKTLRLWDSSTGDALVEFRGHHNFVFSCNFNPHSNLLVSGSFDETVKLWDSRCGECISTLPAHSDPVTGVQFNYDGTCIVSGSHDGLVRVWDTATGECLKTLYAEGNPPVGSVRFSPNGRYVLSGALDGNLRLWDIIAGKWWMELTGSTSTSGRSDGGRNNNWHGGKCSKTYSGHTNSRFCVFSTFSVANPLCPLVVSGSEDGFVYLYDLQSRIVKQKLEGHEDAVLAVDAHDSLELIGSGGMTRDKKVRFWSAAY